MECMSRNPLTLSLGDHSLQSHAFSVFFMFFIQISLIRLVLLTLYVYNPFCYVRKNKFFYVPNILILSRLTNLRVFTNILYDSKERNIINNPPPVGMTKFLCLPMTGVIGSGLEYYT